MQSTVAPENSAQSANGPEATRRAGRPRKEKRTDADGKPMHRLVLVCSETMLGNINAAIAERRSASFKKTYGGPRIPRSGQEDEIKGLALGLICEDWLAGVDEEGQ
jgi:hypothetical protein